MRTETTEVIFFDAAGTLFRLPRGVGWHYRDVASRHGCEIEEEVLGRAFSAVWQEMPARAATRCARPDDDRGWWRELVSRVLTECGGEAAAVLDADAYFTELYAEFTRPGVWVLYPEVRVELEKLRAHYRLGIVSNFDTRLHQILRQLDIADFFQPIVLSSEVGADKPDPWIFQRALELAEIRPTEAAHVGDDSRCDWAGAAAAGLRAFPLRRPGNSLRDLPAWLARDRFAS